jgi:mono/diheme cytochrome c family protein
VAVAWLAAPVSPAAALAPSTAPVTYTKDIAPILQRSCQQCHRPNSIAPMSLLTYQQVRPYARAIKTRTGLRDAPGSRGVMPPWFIEKNIGIQDFKEDISLSDEEIAKIARWVDAGAPEGDAKDLPPAREFADAQHWALGKPDLIVSTPKVLVKGVGSDWWGPIGETPTGMTESRFARAAEVKENSDGDINKLRSGAAAAAGNSNSAYLGQGKTALVVFHHANINVATAPGQEFGDGEGGGGLTLHEVGRNGDVFPPEAGKSIPAGSAITANVHLHSPGVPGADRNAWLDVGLYFHPRGYKPKFREGQIQMASTELMIRPDSDNQRYDSYWVAPQAVRLLNFEPHLHATGIRMCMEAIYQRSIETLNCAGYDHNWVKNYQYDENSAPLLPKGTILHVTAWFDGTAKNPNNIDPRNATIWGRRSVANMFGVENRAIYLTEEQYAEELAKRREFMKTNNLTTQVGCPGCGAGPAQAPANAAAAANQ